MNTEGLIYLDHQSTTPLDPRVFEEMRPYFEGRFGNPHSTEHAVGWRSLKAVERATVDLASLIGCDEDEIIFTSGATEANNLALLGIAREEVAKGRKRVLLSSIEHKCVLEIGRILSSRLGFTVEHLPVDSQGLIKLDALQNTVSEDVFLVSIMLANNEIGTIQNIEKIFEIVSAKGAYLHCDAAQAPCAMDVSQLASSTDLVSLSGHKMYGPVGIGTLYARRELQPMMQPIVHGGGQQNGLRSGTLSTALCVGFGVAARIAATEEGISHCEQLAELRDEFLRLLRKLRCDVWVNGPKSSIQRHPGNLNVGFSGISAADLLSRLQPSLAASTGSACTSGIPEPSHVLRAIGLDDEHVASSVRFSLGRGTTTDDIHQAAALVERAVGDIIDGGLFRPA